MMRAAFAGLWLLALLGRSEAFALQSRSWDGVFVALVFLVGVEARTVRIDVRAPWPSFASGPIVEAAEFLSDYSPSAFWGFATALCADSVRVDGLVSVSIEGGAAAADQQASLPAELQALVFETAATLIPSTLHNLMGTAIGLGAYAPSVQFYHSVWQSLGNSYCGDGTAAFALVYPGGQPVCSLDEYLSLRNRKFVADCIATSNPDACKYEDEQSTFSWDHLYPSASGEIVGGGRGIHVVVYGTMGTSSFCQLHRAVLEDVSRESYSVRYSFRHAFLEQSVLSVDTALPGFGVFLDIKNMEYNTANKEDDKTSAVKKEGIAHGPLDKELESSDDALSGVSEGVDVSGIYFARLLQRRPTDREELVILKEELDKANQEKQGQGGGKVKVWKIKDLGVQTAQAIVSAPSPLDKLAEYVHSFPTYAAELSSIKLKASFADSINTWLSAGMGQFIPQNCLVINGARVDLAGSTFNVFDLLQTVKRELVQQARLLTLGLNSDQQFRLLAAANKIGSGSAGLGGGGAGSEASVAEGVVRIDLSKGGKHVVVFLNNLEKDSQYKRWPKSMRSLLMPSWSLATVARNIYTLIFVVDPLSLDGVNLIMQLHNMHSQQYPVRFGIVLVCYGPNAAPRFQVCQLFAKAKETYGVNAAFGFLLALASHAGEVLQASALAAGVAADELESSSLAFPVVSVEQLQKLYASALQGTQGSWSVGKFAAEAKEALGGKFAVFAHNCTQYLRDRGLQPNSFSLNGIVRKGSEISGLMQLLGREQYIIAGYYRRKLITDKTKSIFTALLSLGRTFSRYHPILDESAAPSADDYVDALPSNPAMAQLLASAHFLEPVLCAGRIGVRNTTMVVVPMTRAGMLSAAAAVQWIADQTELACSNQRLGLFFFHDSADKVLAEEGESAELIKLAVLVNALLFQSSHLGPATTLSAVNAALRALSHTEIEKNFSSSAAFKAVEESGRDLETAIRSSHKRPFLEQLTAIQQNSALATQALGWTNPSRTDALVFHNARKLRISLEQGEIDGGSDLAEVGVAGVLHTLDLELIASIEHSRCGRLLIPLVSFLESDVDGSDLFLRLSSFVGQYSSGVRRYDVHETLEAAGFTSSGEDKMVPAASAPFIFRVPAPVSDASSEGLSVYCIVDPLSVAGQRAAAVLKLLSRQLQLPVTVILTPRLEYSEFPLQNFYRQVLGPGPGSTSTPFAEFASLPHQHTLTIRPDAPEPWNIQAATADGDADNLRCHGEFCHNSETLVTYSLKNVLAAGQCFQVASGGVKQQPAPPKGLQLTLSALDVARGSPSANPVADTLVMQNLGYFQLLANPGLWRLDIAGGNFTIVGPGGGVDYPNSPLSMAASSRFIAVRSFVDVVSRVLVVKLGEDAVAPAATSAAATTSSVWGSIFGGSKSPLDSQVKHSVSANDTIHVFSLATGHMYERLLRIMMLSVVKRSSMHVKFWLFENYLSPTFKNVAAAMAQEFRFEVAYVTYKWPEWLTQQSEKQRIIWGYKILFLDVLFPRDVKRIIYVDADQVVRADLKELWELDLQGKPYGYTPFCDSREETLGFQFWRSGYWAEHLRGKPYHISALYVVDLQRFREYSVGDSLRAVYDGLARDPNSLANLDQDLPNYAQHSVPIHSLPQEWLWCETWCSDKTKEAVSQIMEKLITPSLIHPTHTFPITG